MMPNAYPHKVLMALDEGRLPPVPAGVVVHPPLLELITRCAASDPSARPTAKHVADALTSMLLNIPEVFISLLRLNWSNS